MAVVNIPPNQVIYKLGPIPGTMHVYNTGNPGGGATTYNITILNVGAWTDVVIQTGHTDTYQPNGNVVFVQNLGPSRLQVLYVESELTVEQAGGRSVKEFPVLDAPAG
ncbi:hypothetical protein [Sorangium sp. So ce363]|uniref:hypothetical protein n=1 Tax=Sorangium sp. So ce363 TaxID=3133304 RepID=UPI003F60EEAC